GARFGDGRGFRLGFRRRRGVFAGPVGGPAGVVDHRGVAGLDVVIVVAHEQDDADAGDDHQRRDDADDADEQARVAATAFALRFLRRLVRRVGLLRRLLGLPFGGGLVTPVVV